MGNQSLSLCRCLLPFGNSATSGMALAEARDLNFKIDRACRSRDLFERTSHSRARARRSCGNHSIRRFMDRTVCILRFSKWQANPYPVVFLESFNAIPYTHGTRSLSGSRILSFPEWLKEHEILESGVSVSCNLCSRASSQSALAQPALFTKISTTTAENKVGTHWGILFRARIIQRALNLASAVATHLTGRTRRSVGQHTVGDWCHSSYRLFPSEP